MLLLSLAVALHVQLQENMLAVAPGHKGVTVVDVIVERIAVFACGSMIGKNKISTNIKINSGWCIRNCQTQPCSVTFGYSVLDRRTMKTLCSWFTKMKSTLQLSLWTCNISNLALLSYRAYMVPGARRKTRRGRTAVGVPKGSSAIHRKIFS